MNNEARDTENLVDIINTRIIEQMAEAAEVTKWEMTKQVYTNPEVYEIFQKIRMEVVDQTLADIQKIMGVH